MKLSVIVPSAREWPVAPFCLRSIYEELRDRCDFEILFVDNSMTEEGVDDKVYGQVKGVSRGIPELIPLQYRDKLSHWQAKNLAVQHATGDILFFSDAHCVPSRDAIYNMFNYYCEHYEELNGTLNLPLSYHILEFHRLIYKLAGNISKGEVHYSFSGFQPSDTVYQVPCMSTCGTMMHKSIYSYLGGWPTELGIYGGGENFLNFCLAVTGKTVNIYPHGTLFHHGDKRGYSWNFDDHLRNKFIAAYMYGGADFVRLFCDNSKGRPDQKANILKSVLNNKDCIQHRELIKSRQVQTIQEWWYQWTGGKDEPGSSQVYCR